LPDKSNNRTRTPPTLPVVKKFCPEEIGKKKMYDGNDATKLLLLYSDYLGLQVVRTKAYQVPGEKYQNKNVLYTTRNPI